MGRSKGTPKSVLIATRVTPAISNIIKQLAYNEGLHVSEWVRNVILNELKKTQMLDITLREPMLKEMSHGMYDNLEI